MVWNEKAGLPMGDRGSRQIRASRLLNYLELNVQGKSREAAANFQNILESANNSPLENIAISTNVQTSNYQKASQIRKLQLDALNDRILGKLTTDIQRTRYLQKFKDDPLTFSMLSGLLVANAANLRSSPGRDHLDVADEITKLVQLKHGYGKLNNAAHLAYAQSSEKDLKELLDVIDTRVKSQYGDTPAAEKEFAGDMSSLASMSSLTSAADIPSLLSLIASNDPNSAKLATAIQQTIIASSKSGYISGEYILKHSLASAGLPDSTYTQLARLAPLIEEARQNEVKKVINGDIHESDPRTLHTLNLSSDVGVSPDIPWLTIKDLNATTQQLQTQYGVDSLSGLTDLLNEELNKGASANFTKITQLNNHFKNISQHTKYHGALKNDFILNLRDKIGHGRGRYSAISGPIDRFAKKVGGVIWSVDDFVHSPFRYVADKLFLLEEKYPFLNPGKFVSNKLSAFQVGIAKNILSWSKGIATTATANKSWYAGIFRHISDFSGAFIHTNGDWKHASFHFMEIKKGNLLDWGARFAGFEKGWMGVKAKIGTSLWSGFSKMAPGLAAKVSKGALGKLVASLTAGTLSGGTTLAIQIGLMVIGEGFKKLIQFVRNTNGFRDKVLRRLPMLISAASVALAGIPAALLGGAIALGSALIGSLSLMFTTLLTTVFIPAIIFIGAAIGSLYLLTQVLDITIRLDSGIAENVANIVCTLAGEGAPNTSSNPKLAAGKCLAQLLSKFGINPLTENNAVGMAFNSFSAGLGNSAAAEEAKRSATSYKVFQCVGFDVVVDIMTGGSGTGFGDAKTLCDSPPSGYRPVFGVESCSPGDFFVDENGEYGHTGLFVSNDGPYIKCLDANGGGPGLVRDESSCVWPSSQIACCLKAN